MAGLLFVSQAILDTWAGQGKIDLAGNVMSILAGEGSGRSYSLEPAVRFLNVVGAESDPNGLLRKVKGEAQLREMGAELMSDAVVLGEVAYEVEPGFLAETAALQAAVSAATPARATQAAGPPAPPASGAGERPVGSPAAPHAAAPPLESPELEKRRKEAEALARFLLENLS